MPKTLRDMAVSYADKLGLHVFPLQEHEKLPARKKIGDAAGGLYEASNDAEIVAALWDENVNYNIGLRCGKVSGIWVLDIDGESGAEDLRKLESQYGPLPMTPKQQTANGVHYIFKYPNDGSAIGNRAKLIQHGGKGGLDVRGDGGYIVLAPSVHPSKKIYHWLIKPSACPFADAPQWLLDLVIKKDANKYDFRKISYQNYKAKLFNDSSPERILQDRLNDVRNAPEGQRNPTLNIASMFVGKVLGHLNITQREAENLLYGAALESGLDDHEIMPTINSGMKFGLSNPYEYGKYENKHFNDFKKNTETNEGTRFDPETGEILEENNDKKSFRLVTFDDIINSPRVDWLIRGVFPKKSFAIMYGPPGSAKTFVVLDMALCVAHGMEWNSCPVVQGGVLYIVGEGIGGLSARIKAWTSQFAKNESKPPFYAITAPVNFQSKEDVDAVKKAVKSAVELTGMNFSMIIVDTVARSILGADENDAKEMGLFVAACDDLKHETGASVIGIHHAGKDNEKGMRGSSALLGAVDVSIKITQEIKGQILMQNEKQKDADRFDDIVFKAIQVATSVHDTSIVLETDKDSSDRLEAENQKRVRSRKVNLYLEALFLAISDSKNTLNGQPSCNINLWRDICSRRALGGDSQDSKARSFRRAREKLQAQNLIYIDGDMVSYIGTENGNLNG